MDGPTCRHGFTLVFLSTPLLPLALRQGCDLPSPLTLRQQLDHNHVTMHGSVTILTAAHQHAQTQI